MLHHLKKNPVASIVLSYQKVINTMAFASGTRVNNLTMTLSGILTRKLSAVKNSVLGSLNS